MTCPTRVSSLASTRIAAGGILAVFCSFLWINASYYYWDGGWSTGPRHLVPALPLSCLALAFAWRRGFWFRMVTLVLIVASLALSLISAAVSMLAPANYGNPLVEFLLPNFLTSENLLESTPIIVIWSAFGLLFFFQWSSSVVEAG